MMELKYTDFTGKLDPCICEINLKNGVQLFLGFHTQERCWKRVLVNAPDIITSAKNDILGFPHVLQEGNVAGNRIVVCEDAKRVDKLIYEEILRNKPPPIKLASEFLKCINSVLEYTDYVSLNPATVYITNKSIQFAGAGILDEDTSLLSWISTIITGDMEFLNESFPIEQISKWEGCIPQEWNQESIWTMSIRSQLELVAKYLDTSKSDQYTTISNAFFDSMSTPLSKWGLGASLSFTLLNSQKSSVINRDLLPFINKWTPDILEWGWTKEKFQGPTVEWFLQYLLQNSGKLIKNNVIRILPVIACSSFISLAKIPILKSSISEFCSTLVNLFDFSGIDENFLKNPDIIEFRKLPNSSRKSLFPILLLYSVAVNRRVVFPADLGFNMIIEFNQKLGNSPIDQCMWYLLQILVQYIEPPLQTGTDIIVQKLLEDLNKLIKEYPIDKNYLRSEMLASLIIFQSWILNPQYLHAAGEMYDKLKKNQELNFAFDKNPCLDFAEILITKENGTAHEIWIELAQKFVQNHPNHKFTKIVSNLLQKDRKRTKK